MLGLALFVDQTDRNVGELLDGAGITGFIAGSVGGGVTGNEGLGGRDRPGRRAVRPRLPVLGAPPLATRRDRARVAPASHEDAEPGALDAPLPRLAVAFMVVGSSAAPIRRALDFPLDVAADAITYGVVVTTLWLVLSWFLLPHGAESIRELLPGALLVGVGIAAIGLFNTLVLFPWLAEREETYGVLGIAAGLLFGFFLFGRTVELAASLNATLAEERRRRVPQ